MKYKYSVVPGQLDIGGRVTRRPVVEVEISNGKVARKFLALIDSGADQITMPAAIAEALGIDRAACKTRSVFGISMEHSEGFVAELSFRLRNQASSFTAPVIFIDTDVPVLLGREGFFDHHRIRFEQDHDTFAIAPINRQ
ncbi:aspartyl protease family protein [Bradyrhizobium manausense]|uniref:Peptidase A2 domain-containing protein n=1 Tax=Bradyrhizobium manausense TaxID=989370 RepID=A0A0R3E8C2_9BRAD|nr:aspartyl protease family protein [Bradyrhizobium manausense]KRQ15359.1 hypothetical protein AOQ71_10185 [Bradyrhizobium manausense]